MIERLPVAPRGTEPARATVVTAGFTLRGLWGRPDPAPAAADESQMEATIPGPNLAFPLLSMQIEIGGRSDLGEELRRREPLGGPPDVRRAVALRHPQGIVDDRGGVDLHGDRIGVGGVQ